MDGFFDPAVALLQHPSRAASESPYEQPGIHLTRESSWYALSLLQRDAPGDRARAGAILDAVLAQQIDAPAVAAGSFRRAPEEPPLPPEPREWIDYDPNWREFLGTAFALILSRHEAALPPATVASLESALLRATRGSLERAVSPEYSNIALMSAFLLDWVGDRLGDGELRAAGSRLARGVCADHAKTEAFREYNSPTYYGVDLVALAAWRDLAPDPWLREQGARLEAALWCDLARFWHADLGNPSGPYTRAYGMDQADYVSCLGLCVDVGCGSQALPRPVLPPLGDAMLHAHDRCMEPVVSALPPRIPPEARRHFESFQGERVVRQIVQREPFERRASAWLGRGTMLGGEDASGRHVHHQHHPVTAHWLETDGRLGWLRLRTDAPVRARAADRRLEIEVETGVDWLREARVRLDWVGLGGARAERDDRSLCFLTRDGTLRLSGGAPPTRLESRGDAGAIRTWRTEFAPGSAPQRVAFELSLVD